MANKYLDQEGLGVLWDLIKEKLEEQETLQGYYLNGKFYTDSTYTVELEKNTKHLYVDLNSNGSYVWDGTKFVPAIEQANALKAGILKLHDGAGTDILGTMTQKSITEGVKSIKFDISETDDECLILDLPWD